MTAGDLIAAVVLGLVEGATEFIPVSSTGHLILAADWLEFTGERAKSFTVFIQLGAILAIVALYWRKLWRVTRTVFRDPASTRLALNLAVAFVPAAVVGFLARHWIRDHLFRPLTVALALVIGGILMLLIEWRRPRASVADVDDLPLATALGVGLAQVLALVPGVSRSGATIMGGYALGLSRAAATEFSFFLAIPVMLAATLFDLFESFDVLSAADVPVFALGFVVAFVSALVVVRVFLGFVARHSFAVFAVYRILFGGLLLGWIHWSGS